MKYVKYLMGVCFFLMSMLSFGQNNQLQLTSPDGEIEINFATERGEEIPAGQLTYQILYQGEELIEPSQLLLLFPEGDSLGNRLRVIDENEKKGIRESYHLITGRTNKVEDLFNEITIELEETEVPNRRLNIIARAYNDGVAFRYEIPEQEEFPEISLSDERTEFQLSDDAISYALVLPHFESMYESEFIKLPSSAFANQGGVSSTVLMGLPLLMEVPGTGWAAVIDADLEGYSSAYITNPSGSWTGHMFETRLSPQLENEHTAVTADSFPFRTSWKAVMIADNPGRFIESNLITGLNPESKIEDTSWIEAGKASWNWWSGSIGADGEGAYTTENMKYYVDFAAASGFKYMLIDAGWSTNDLTEMQGNVDVPEVVEYAAEKGVRIWIWVHYDGLKDQMDEALPLYEEWGVAGIKIDFVERDDQKGLQFYYDVAEKAAEHHIMVDFHGSTKPTGIQRTWPNVLGFEAVVGMEQSKAGRRDNPEMHVMLPYTRMITGLMDYTPGGFDNVTRDEFVSSMTKPMVMGTRAHHLAMYVVYESPLQMVSDHPSAYEGEEAFEFIKAVPASWDETVFLDGLPGEYVVIARRNGDDWYLGSMTDWNSREVDIDLSFLGKGKYKAVVYADHPDAEKEPKKTLIQEKVVDSETGLSVKLAEGGGCAVLFTLQN